MSNTNESQLVEVENTQLATTQSNGSAITPAGMLQIAVEKGADLDKLEKLMELQERWEKNEAKKAYTDAMSKFRSECPTILKTRQAHNSTYAGLAETISQIKGLLAKNGLSHSWRTEQGDKTITVTCCITHSEGHSECTSLSAGADSSGSKNSIQAIGSTVTYLERYTLVAILGLASSDQDDDGVGYSSNVEYISKEQEANLDSLISEVGANKANFLKYLRVKDLSQLPANKYNGAVKSLEKKRKQ
ncbi:MAG: ERF family protein [Candidatus Thiodiazotropha lotti]|nr:ERF family protein [Candidatus Thiodiazotropha lotti]MCW4222172.1 ERF family protein [Candidatus Thiodiazotropha lotti]